MTRRTERMHNELESRAKNSIDAVGRSLLEASWSNTDGGFGRADNLPSDTWSTAEAIDLAIETGATLANPRLAAARRYLLDAQNDDGGWGAMAGNVSDTTATSLALIALSKCDHQTPPVPSVPLAVGWLVAHQNADGGWPLVPDSTKPKPATVFTTAHAAVALATWFRRGVSNPSHINEALTLAGNMLTGARTESGAWGLTRGSDATARHTGYVILMCTAPDVVETGFGVSLSGRSRLQRSAAWLRRTQRDDGGWGAIHSDVESTSAALAALLAVGRPSKSKNVRAGVMYLLRNLEPDDSRGRFAVREPHSGLAQLWTTFYATSALLAYVRASERERRRMPGVRLNTRRRMVAGGGLAASAVGGAITLADVGDFSLGALVASAGAVAGIVAAWPVVDTLRKRLGERLSP